MARTPDPEPAPWCVLVVGMHRSGTSATASALGELGLALPRDEDMLGARFGNERGHFESLSLLAFCDRLLAKLGRSWDDPPEPYAGVPAALEGDLEEGRELFEAAFGTPSRPVTWKDPRLSVLLPFWRAAIARPIATLVVVRDPLAVASSLHRRNALPLPVGLSLWERYVRLGLEGARGLPTYVSSFADSLAEPERSSAAIGDWLTSLGVLEAAAASRPGPSTFDPSLVHEGRGAGDRGGASGASDPASSPVLPAHSALFDAVLGLRGPHEAFAPDGLGEESGWTSTTLGSRHDLVRLWGAFDFLGREIARIPEPPPRNDPATAYVLSCPPDATEDEAAYHAWLTRRGEATSVGAKAGFARAATSPPRAGAAPLFSIVVPVYNTPLWALDRCVSSVLGQDFASFELRLVDDASPDPALGAHLRKVARRDPRISLTTRPTNGGIAAATNDGVGGARGEWVVLLDHDDELAAGALSRLADAVAEHGDAGLIYTDEDKIDASGRRFMPAFKPNWSPDLLTSNAYMCHLLVVRRSLVDDCGGLRNEFDGAQDYDLMLRATERLRDDQIVHLPEVLYHWRVIEGSASGDTTAKPWAFEAGRRALADAVARRGIDAEVTICPGIPGSYEVRRRVVGRPRVTAIVPFRDEPALLAACYRAFVADPGHDEFELLLVDNDSALPETQAVLASLSADPRVRVLQAPGEFDWVRINNEAAEKATGELLLFLNNDVEARSAGWLAHLVAQAQRPEVGAVGARLVFPDGSVQHGGVAVGVCWGAAHTQQGLPGDRPGYLSHHSVTRDVSAVTGACMMTRREVFESAGGFDPSLPVAFNDIDYCLRLRERGLLVVYTPLAELVHHESVSRGHSDDAREIPYFRRRWRDLMLAGDPYYNPNLGRFDSYCRLPNEEDDTTWEIFRSTLDES
jgi:GT2 family glycosyltransferase